MIEREGGGERKKRQYETKKRKERTLYNLSSYLY